MKQEETLSAYSFFVELDGIETARFQKCEGLEAETETFEYEEGGGKVHHFQGRSRFPNLILEKGINDNNELFKWFQSITKDEKVERKNGSVVLKNNQGEEIKRWNFFRAFPCRWIGPKLDYKDPSTFAVERIEIVHEGLEVDNDAEIFIPPFELKVDKSKWIAQAGISDVPIYYDDNGNPSSDPYAVTGRNMGEPETSIPIDAVDNLIAVQDTVMENPIYQEGGGGPFGNSTGTDTWCNQATFEIARDAAPRLADAMYGTDPNGYNTTANMAAANLVDAANDINNSVVEINPETAQNLANQGYTVVAARENPTGRSGHIATVRPGFNYNETNEPVLNNIGARQRTGIRTTSEAFPGNGEVHFYYDTTQF